MTVQPVIPYGEFNNNGLMQPLIFGCSYPLANRHENLNLSGGSQTINLASVPEDELHIYTNIAFRYVGTAPGRLVVAMVLSGVEYEIWGMTPPVSNLVYDRQGQWILAPGDNMRLLIQNATATNDIYWNLTGYKMVVRK